MPNDGSVSVDRNDAGNQTQSLSCVPDISTTHGISGRPAIFFSGMLCPVFVPRGIVLLNGKVKGGRNEGRALLLLETEKPKVRSWQTVHVYRNQLVVSRARPLW